jgi:group I intron endonuclease
VILEKDTGKYIIYKTTNLINGHIYIGKHITDTPYTFDGYLGSGLGLQKAIKKYGKENFKRETLFVYDDEEDAYNKESEIVTKEFRYRHDVYNACDGGLGFLSGERNPRFGFRYSDEEKKSMSERFRGKNGPFWGHRHTEETKAIFSKAMSGVKHPFYGKFGKEHPSFGTCRSEETKKKMREAKIGAKNNRFGYSYTRLDRKNMSIAFLGQEEYDQRVLDIIFAEKVRGWKSKLARKWGVSSCDKVTRFALQHAEEIDRVRELISNGIILRNEVVDE